MVVALVALAGCTVLQPYRRPANVAPPELYRDTLAHPAPGEDSAKAAVGAPIVPERPPVTVTDTATFATLPWKQVFTDTILQKLIQAAIDSNLDLKIAVARIGEAQANFRQSRLAFFPSLGANAGATLQKVPSGSSGSSQAYELYLNSAWEVDLWGKLRSASRAELADLLQSYAYRSAVQTQLVASIATDYYALMAYDQELKVTIATVGNRKEDVKITQDLMEGDVVTGAAFMQSQAGMYSVAVTIPDIKENIRETENAICYLLARPSGRIDRDSLDVQQLPPSLGTGVPLQLLSNRPDVQEAEFQLRNGAELTNVARTYFYPALTITGEGGVSNSNLGQLLNASSVFANLIGGLTQPIFDNGLNRQRLEVAKGVQEEYLNDFKEALLTAGQEVSNALFDYKSATDKIRIRAKEIYYLQKAVDETQELMKYDQANYTDVLTSEQNLLAGQLAGISDKLQQLQAVVTLYTSLGGGWR